VDGFTPTQIVEAAILTCTSTSATATTTTCDGPKLNGLDIRFGIAEANAICHVVTGGGFNFVFSNSPPAVPYFIWNGSSWALSSTAISFRIVSLNCNLS